MPLSGSSKQAATVSTYSRWFHTFDGAGDGKSARAWAAALRDVTAKKDPRFARADLAELTKETIVLRAELFGLAWGHAFTGKDKYLLGEGRVAKEVLGGQGLWERGGKYNSAAAKSTETALPKGERTRQGVVAFQNSVRVSMFENWVKQGADKPVIVRVLNRFFTEDSWKNGQTLRYLEMELVKQLGFVKASRGELDLNEAALLAIQVALLDIYQGSREGIKKANIKAD